MKFRQLNIFQEIKWNWEKRILHYTLYLPGLYVWSLGNCIALRMFVKNVSLLTLAKKSLHPLSWITSFYQESKFEPLYVTKSANIFGQLFQKNLLSSPSILLIVTSIPLLPFLKDFFSLLYVLWLILSKHVAKTDQGLENCPQI